MTDDVVLLEKPKQKRDKKARPKHDEFFIHAMGLIRVVRGTAYPDEVYTANFARLVFAHVETYAYER